MQFVGLRDDLPDGYQQWFSKAQEDNKLRSPVDHVQQTLAAFGPNLTWNYEPLKSASIAQVHLDVTWGSRAAVAKVQHPHVRDQYLADLETMKYLGEYVNHHDEAKGAAVMLGALAEKLRPTVVAETDFTVEAENQRRLRESLRGIAIVPEVFAATTTAGEKLDHFGPRQRRNLYSIYAQMVSGGLFQADPHPGNIVSLKETEGADAICLLDFGQCCEVTPEQRILFHAFAAGAPTSVFEANDQKRNLEWLNSLGIEVRTAKQAQAAANLLFFGQKSPMFPDTKAINPELTPLLLLVLYLSRFENKVVELRRAVGFEDEADPFELTFCIGCNCSLLISASDNTVRSARENMEEQLTAETFLPLAAVRSNNVAVRAMAARLPSGIQSMSDMWMKLQKKEDFTSEIPASRWDVAFYVCTNDEVPGKVYLSRGGFVPDDFLYDFEAQYFRMSNNEARAMEPQFRMMLEIAAEVAEPCGYLKSKGSTSYEEKHHVSCIMGQTSSEYLSASTLHLNQGHTGRFTNTGTNTCMLSNRISYTFNFKGPSFTVDTACSSALYAFIMSVQHVQHGCAGALAGGANALLLPTTFIGFCAAGMLSPDGRCKSFDNNADGYARSEGAGGVFLTPVDRTAWDFEWALVRGSGFQSRTGRSCKCIVRNNRPLHCCSKFVHLVIFVFDSFLQDLA
eukprot:s1171_g4.t1